MAETTYTQSAGMSGDTSTTDNVAELADQAATSAASAAADLVLTDADQTATAADRVQTAADRSAVAADLVLTDADTTATSADVTATNADVVLTNADAATTAQDAIDTAADVVLTNADAATTAQDAIDTAADVVLTNADAATTAQDAIDTAADVIAAAASAANAVSTAVNMPLVDDNLVVAVATNMQAFAEKTDSALSKARGTGFTSNYVSTAGVGGTTFAQPAVSGEIASDQGYFSISYAGATGVTVANLAVNSTYVYIDNAGNLQQQTAAPTRQDWSRKMFTMRIAVDTVAGTILGFEYLANPIGHYGNTFRDFYSFLLAQGVPFKKDQVVTGRSDLGFDVSAGELMEYGGTGQIHDANIRSFDSVSNATYSLLSRTAVIGDQTDLVKYWDNAGTITALGSTTVVGHRLYRFSNGTFAMQYGQGNYANIDLAKTGAVLEAFDLNPRLLNATFFGWWFIQSTATVTTGTPTLTAFVEYTLGIQGGISSALSGCLLKGNNLSDLLDAAVARTNIGLGTGDSPTFAGGTLTGDMSFGDDDKAIFGAGSDLQIYHDGSHSRIDEQGTGVLFLQTDGTSIQLNKGTSENMLVANVDASVDLYYDNALKISTTATGISVTGTITSDGLTVDGDIHVLDDVVTLALESSNTNGQKWSISSTYTNTGGSYGALIIEDEAGSDWLRFDEGNGSPFSQFLVNGSEAMRIDASGNVGIGTSSPDQALHVEKSVAGGGTELLVVNSGANQSGTY
jgi:hypothetical protein